MGSLYKRGEVFWIKYYRHGKPYRESSKTDKITEAQRLLKRREGEIAEGKLPGVYFDKVTFDALAKDLVTDYTVNGRDTLKRVKWSIDCLKESFGGMRATDITTDKVKTHIEKRMKYGLTNASINRELAVLKRMFSLGAESTPPKVNLIPYIPMLKESNTRKGFFELGEYLALKSALPSYLKPVVTFAYHTGWRSGEVLNLTWDKVDLKQGIISLDPGETKSEEARTVYLNEELMTEIKALHVNRRLGCPWVFHRDGEAVKSFRKAWATACIKAGLFKVVKDDQGNETKTPTKIFHDFRRTGVRNMVRAGIPERVAMMVSGHKTRSVFERYNIVSDQDLKEAAKKMQTYHESLNNKMGTIEQKGEVIPMRQISHLG
jgi:integrase